MTADVRGRPSVSMHRVTLVLGGGWKLGCAFHAGVIMALNDTWGLDARHVDCLIGTSSGAVVGALLSAGMSPEDLFRRETDEELSPAGQALMRRVGRDETVDDPHSDDPHSDDPAITRTRQLHRTVGWSARGALAALLPRGKQPNVALEGYFDDLIGPDWPATVDLQLCAVDLGTGQRVALDRNSGATVGQAVAASCAVPGVSQPVPIRGREYVDGAIYSINNADLALSPADDEARHGVSSADRDPVRHTVIVSAPLSASHLQLRFGPIAVLRNAMRLQTAAELRKLRDVDQLIVLEPTRADIAAMGSDMNANTRRGRVANSAYTSALDSFIAAPAPIVGSVVGAVG